MSTFQVRIEDLVGSVGDTAFISDALTDEAAKVMDLLPFHKVSDYTKPTNITSVGLSVPGERIISVFNTAGYSAVGVTPHLGVLAIDENSIYFATDRDPVYYLDPSDQKYFIVSGGEKSSGKFISIAYPTIAFGDTPGVLASGDEFPKDIERVVVLGSSIRCRVRQLADKRGSLPGTLSITATAPSVPAAPSFTYTDAVLQGITSGVTKTLAGSAPSYTNSSVTIDWTKVDAYVDTAATEDVELANAKIQQFRGQVEEYLAEVQDALHTFNEANVVYQSRTAADMAELQSASQSLIEKMGLSTNIDLQNQAQNLQKQVAEYTAKVQKYSAEMQAYATNVGKEVQQHTSSLQNFSTEHQLMTGELQGLIAEYALELKLLMGV